MIDVPTYEGADHQHNTLNHARRQAVAERLATTSWHEHKHISTCRNVGCPSAKPQIELLT